MPAPEVARYRSPMEILKQLPLSTGSLGLGGVIEKYREHGHS